MLYQLSTGDIQFTVHKEYKLKGLASLNTSTLENPFCQKMICNKDLVCGRCYAKTLEQFRHLVHERFAKNGVALSKKIKDSEVPIVNWKTVRFNSFGELINATHYKNLLKIVEANPGTMFALWTKRYDIIKKHRKDFDNLIHVYSSPKMNTVSTKFEKMFDKIFTVFNIKYVRENNVDINCTGSCATCMLCYTHNDVKYINERVRAS